MTKALDKKTSEPVSIAAAIAGNCEPCLKFHFSQAKKAGCKREEVKEVIKIAKMVKDSPIQIIYKLADKLVG
jgi:AhpD family alkylhydroperoxidase